MVSELETRTRRSAYLVEAPATDAVRGPDVAGHARRGPGRLAHARGLGSSTSTVVEMEVAECPRHATITVVGPYGSPAELVWVMDNGH